MLPEDGDDPITARRRLQRDHVAVDQALGEHLQRVDAGRDPPRDANPAFLGDRDLTEVAMNIQPHPAHSPPLIV